MKDVERFETVRDAAKACVTRSVNREAALTDLVQVVRADPALLLQITEVHLQRLCADLLSDVYRGRREAAVNEANARLSPDWEAQMAKAGGRLLNSTASLLDFVLIDGTPLREADGRKINESATYYKREGKEKLARGEWLTLIANVLPKGKLAGQFFRSDEPLQKFWGSTHAEAPKKDKPVDTKPTGVPK